MAVIGVAEIWPGRDGQVTKTGQRQYVRQFRVVTNDTFDDALVVTASPLLPRRWSIYATPYNFDYAARLQEIIAKQDGSADDPRVWIVECRYYTPDAKQSQGEPDPSQQIAPWQRPALITWDFSLYSKPILETPPLTAGGGVLPQTAILNAAGDRFDPAPQIEDCRPTLTIVKNLIVFDPSLALTYTNATNADGFFGASTGQWKVRRIGAQSQFESGYYFWVQTAEFEYRDEGWDLVLVNAGFNQITPAAGGAGPPNKSKITDRNGREFSTPQLLDKNGKWLGPGNVDYNTLTFTVYQSLPFAGLNLP